jgi:hypothetical protein
VTAEFRDRRPPQAVSDREVVPDVRRQPTIKQRGWTIRKFVRTVRRYRTIQIRDGAYPITAVDPLPDDLASALGDIHRQPVRTNLSQLALSWRRLRGRRRGAAVRVCRLGQSLSCGGRRPNVRYEEPGWRPVTGWPCYRSSGQARSG